MFREFPADRIPDLPYARFALIDQVCYPRFTSAQVGQLSVPQVNIMGVKYMQLKKEMWPYLQPAPFERMLRYLAGTKPRAQAVKDYVVHPNNPWNCLEGVFAGNKTFGNYKKDSKGKPLLPEVPYGQYKEFDIHARSDHEKRDKYRIVVYIVPTNQRYKAWYTKTHYDDFWPLD
jgi:ribonuclease